MAKIVSHNPGGRPTLGRTSVLAHGPARPGGSQPARDGQGRTGAEGGGNKGNAVSSRETPRNPRGLNQSVQPAPKQP